MACNIIIATHGSLAEALVETSELIIGAHENVHAVGLAPGTEPERFRAAVEELVAAQGKGGVLILLDLLAGTPFNTVIPCMKNECVQLVTGVNLPMVLETVMQSDECGPAELAQVAVESGGAGIRCKRDIME